MTLSITPQVVMLSVVMLIVSLLLLFWVSSCWVLWRLAWIYQTRPNTRALWANVITLLTAVIYQHSIVLPSFCAIKLFYLSSYHGMTVNYRRKSKVKITEVSVTTVLFYIFVLVLPIWNENNRIQSNLVFQWFWSRRRSAFLKGREIGKVRERQR